MIVQYEQSSAKRAYVPIIRPILRTGQNQCKDVSNKVFFAFLQFAKIGLISFLPKTIRSIQRGILKYVGYN